MVGRTGVHVLAVRGELDLDTAGELRRRLASHDGRARATVIDLSECGFIDSTGIGLLVRAWRRASEDGGAGIAIVAAPESQVRRTLRLTNVDSTIPVVGSPEAALGALETGGQAGVSRKTSTE